MPPHRRRSFGSSRRSRRRVIWAEFDAVLNFTANSQWYMLDVLQTYKAATGNTVAKCTVMRTHAYLVPTIGGTTGDRIWTGFKVSDVDDTSGAVTTLPQVPNPRDNPYVDWAFMSRHSFDLSGFIHPSSIDGGGGEAGSGIVWDLKSKRRLNNLQETWAFCVLQDNVTTVASTKHLFVRTLLALP